MPALKNLKHEKFCRKIVAGESQRQAYHKLYNSKDITNSECNSTRLVQRDDIRTRCLEILDKTAGLKLSDGLMSLKDLSQAQKDIVIDKVIHSVKDNPTRLEATKTILKLHGLLTSNERGNTQVDARTVSFHLDGNHINQLDTIITRLSSMDNRQEDKIEGELNAEIRDSVPIIEPSSGNRIGEGGVGKG